MRILYLNHTGHCSGAENAMLRLLEGIPPEHPRAVACPADGDLKQLLRKRGITQFDVAGTTLSLSPHPVQTPQSIVRLVESAWALRSAARRFGADLVHANSVRAGLMASVTRRVGGPPVVVQCHDDLPESRIGNLTRHALYRGADAVVAVTDHTAATFNRGLPRPIAERVYISVDHAHFRPADAAASQAVRDELGVPKSAVLLAHVGQITPWKGQDVAIRALGLLREHVDAHLIVVGKVTFQSRRYDNEAFHAQIRSLTRALGLEDAVHFLGQRSDVPALMGAAALLTLPSWNEPFGLVVAESLAVGTPVLVTANGGVSEYVENGVNGRVLDPRDARLWAEAALELLSDPERLDRMGYEGIRTAARFNDARYAEGMLDVYERARRR